MFFCVKQTCRLRSANNRCWMWALLQSLQHCTLGLSCRLLLHSRSSSGHQQELTSQRGALQDAAAQQAGVQACVRARLQEVLLQPEEAEAAALQCAWLSHHWVSRHAWLLLRASCAPRSSDATHQHHQRLQHRSTRGIICVRRDREGAAINATCPACIFVHVRC